MKQSMNTKVAKLEGRNDLVFKGGREIRKANKVKFYKEVNDILQRYNKRNERTFEEAKELTAKDLDAFFKENVEGYTSECLILNELEFMDEDKGLHIILAPKNWEDTYKPIEPFIVLEPNAKSGAVVHKNPIEEILFDMKQELILDDILAMVTDENGNVDDEELCVKAQRAMTIFFSDEVDGFENFKIEVRDNCSHSRFGIFLVPKETPVTSYFKAPKNVAEEMNKHCN